MTTYIEQTESNSVVLPPRKKNIEAPKSDLEKQRETFKKQQDDALKMMMAVMKNPDPTNSEKGLKPQDLMQMTSQIINMQMMFSSAERNEELRLAINGMVDTQDAHLVGKSVRMESDQLNLNVGGAYFAYEIADKDIEDTTINILNSNGDIVKTMKGEYKKGLHRQFWDGVLDNGTKLLPGTYRIIVSGTATDASTRNQKTFAFPKIHEIERETIDGKDKTNLILEYDDRFEVRPYNKKSDKLPIVAPSYIAAA